MEEIYDYSGNYDDYSRDNDVLACLLVHVLFKGKITILISKRLA
jgi:hypothetical protein